MAALLLVANTTSTISIVYVNKIALNQMPLPITLTFIHQVTLTVMTTILSRGKEQPVVSTSSAIWMGSGFALSLIGEPTPLMCSFPQSVTY
jgi:hypothetical protein